MKTTITFDATVLNRKERALMGRVKDPSQPLKEWAVEEGTDINREWGGITFARLYGGPVSFRGAEVWKKIPPQYVRKTDGVEGPPWGGVPRIRAGVKQVASDIATGRAIYGRHARVSGTVKGKKRPSGARVRPSDIVMADTNEARRQFTLTPALAANKLSIALVTNRPEARHMNRVRRFAVLNSESYARLGRKCRAFMASLAQKWNRS